MPGKRGAQFDLKGARRAELLEQPLDIAGAPPEHADGVQIRLPFRLN